MPASNATAVVIAVIHARAVIRLSFALLARGAILARLAM